MTSYQSQRTISPAHVYPGAYLTSAVERILRKKEQCLAFICGAPGSGKSHLALHAAQEFGPDVTIISDDLSYDGCEAYSAADFPLSLRKLVANEPHAIIVDDLHLNARACKDKIALALACGIPVSNIFWCVLDQRLAQDNETLALASRLAMTFGPPKPLLTPSAISSAIRELRNSYFRHGNLVDWDDGFVNALTMKKEWGGPMEWDAMSDDGSARKASSMPPGSPIRPQSQGFSRCTIASAATAIALSAPPRKVSRPCPSPESNPRLPPSTSPSLPSPTDIAPGTAGLLPTPPKSVLDPGLGHPSPDLSHFNGVLGTAPSRSLGSFAALARDALAHVAPKPPPPPRPSLSHLMTYAAAAAAGNAIPHGESHGHSYTPTP